jgi:hypothetical protein
MGQAWHARRSVVIVDLIFKEAYLEHLVVHAQPALRLFALPA